MQGPEKFGRLREPQLSYLEAGDRRADFIGRTETFASDLAQVCGRLGLAAPPEETRRNAGPEQLLPRPLLTRDARPGGRAVPRRPRRVRVRVLMALPLVMGVVNVTPDSFSDGGLYADTAAAIAHGRQLLADGADILDVGGESTRPGATRPLVEEELDRVIPVIAALAEGGATVSVDTMRHQVAEAALAAGASIVNDVSGGLADPRDPARGGRRAERRTSRCTGARTPTT